MALQWLSIAVLLASSLPSSNPLPMPGPCNPVDFSTRLFAIPYPSGVEGECLQHYGPMEKVGGQNSACWNCCTIQEVGIYST